MNDQPQHPGRPESDDIAGSRLVPQVGMMLKAFWASPIRNTLLWLAGVIFLVIVSTAYGQIRLNRWNEPFYDALARRAISKSSSCSSGYSASSRARCSFSTSSSAG
jgi:putative ATP-binding cassette transporter